MSSIPNSAMPHAGGTASSNSPQQQQQQRDQTAQSGGNQPRDYTSGSSYSARERDSGTLMDGARDHKTGIAVGVAVGAIAAAAIPFMLSGKKRSTERRDYSNDHQAEIRVDTRDSSTSGSSGTGSY